MHPHVPTRAVNITNQYDDHELQSALDTTIAWDELLTESSAGGTFWLTTTDPAGRPHTRPVFAVQANGSVFVASSRRATKRRALSSGGPISLALSRPGIDLVWSGVSRPVTERSELDAVAAAYVSIYGWDVTVEGAALTAPYGAPTAGSPPYDVFAVVPCVVHAVGTDTPFTGRSTRWDIAHDASPAPTGPIVVAGRLRVAASERTAYLEGCYPVVAAARNADGCLDFAISADLVDPERINIYERWTDIDTLHRFRKDGPSGEQAAAIIDACVDEFDAAARPDSAT